MTAARLTKAVPISSLTYVTRTVPGGWTLEVAVPATALGLTALAADQTYPFTFGLWDDDLRHLPRPDPHDLARHRHLHLPAGVGHAQPQQHRLRLPGRPNPDPHGHANADADTDPVRNTHIDADTYTHGHADSDTDPNKDHHNDTHDYCDFYCNGYSQRAASHRDAFVNTNRNTDSYHLEDPIAEAVPAARVSVGQRSGVAEQATSTPDARNMMPPDGLFILLPYWSATIPDD